MSPSSRKTSLIPGMFSCSWIRDETSQTLVPSVGEVRLGGVDRGGEELANEVTGLVV